MIIIATNLEKVENAKNGLDEHLKMIIQECSMQKIPLIYCFNRNYLGRITKGFGNKASIVGIFNYQGANKEFETLISLTSQNRELFYERLRARFDEGELRLLMKENEFLQGHMLVSREDKVSRLLNMAEDSAAIEDMCLKDLQAFLDNWIIIGFVEL